MPIDSISPCVCSEELEKARSISIVCRPYLCAFRRSPEHLNDPPLFPAATQTPDDSPVFAPLASSRRLLSSTDSILPASLSFPLSLSAVLLLCLVVLSSDSLFSTSLAFRGNEAVLFCSPLPGLRNAIRMTRVRRTLNSSGIWTTN